MRLFGSPNRLHSGVARRHVMFNTHPGRRSASKTPGGSRLRSTSAASARRSAHSVDARAPSGGREMNGLRLDVAAARRSSRAVDSRARCVAASRRRATSHASRACENSSERAQAFVSLTNSADVATTRYDSNRIESAPRCKSRKRWNHVRAHARTWNISIIAAFAAFDVCLSKRPSVFSFSARAASLRVSTRRRTLASLALLSPTKSRLRAARASSSLAFSSARLLAASSSLAALHARETSRRSRRARASSADAFVTFAASSHAFGAHNASEAHARTCACSFAIARCVATRRAIASVSVSSSVRIFCGALWSNGHARAKQTNNR